MIRGLPGSLLTQDFLAEGIRESAAWHAVDDVEIERFRAEVIARFAKFPIDGNPNEQQTEDEVIVPVLASLGWRDFLRQQSAGRRREDIPDILLFGTPEAKASANRERTEPRRYRHGRALVESKAWGVVLDRGPADDLFTHRAAPSSQMLRYLSRAEIESDRAIQWGMLTNGRRWRLYFNGARSRSEDFLELDLPLLASVPGIQPELFDPSPETRRHLLKVFYLMFGRAAFVPAAEDRRTFHEIALDRTREWETRISGDLTDLVFKQIFPELLNALAHADPRAPKGFPRDYLEEIRTAGLTLLYRLLFVLYAEDRNLLPAHDSGYDDYSLIKLRQEIRDRIDRGDGFSDKADTLWQRMRTVFRLVDEGDSTIGLPPYNGGLFDPRLQPLLDRVRLSDQRVARLIDGLSRSDQGGQRKWINYRDLSVQHLGSIYERLLEYGIAVDGGRVVIQLNRFARKGSGSFYTHDDLVRLILDRALRPLIAEQRRVFRERAAALAKSKERKADRIAKLQELDPAEAILKLRICDPAMGSGHFLVSVVDYLADAALEALDAPAQDAPWADEYTSPVAGRLAAVRQRIKITAEKEKWKIPGDRLDDRHLVRRAILKRSIYGIDKNPMAVELAKVALWLHTFTVGAPLSFLDHHLRCGDSLFGERVSVVLSRKGGLLISRYVQQAKQAALGMQTVEEAADADLAEVRASSETFAAITADTAGLGGFLDFIHGLRWATPLDEEDQRVVDELLDGVHGDVVRLVSGEMKTPDRRLALLIARLRGLAARERFLHWEVAFPGVWRDWDRAAPFGGFDAVIGNPPWDRIKLQEVEWFATRRIAIAKAARASDRKSLIAKLEKSKDPLWNDYLAAGDRAERMGRVARTSGYYPKLSGGDTNIYSLFVERARSLLKPDGILGLLVPSGISSDKSASGFFREIASGGHLAALFDFENRWPTYFPDVDSRFKFSVFVAGATERRFAKADCAFFLNGVGGLSVKMFSLSAEDFTRVNPNTGTAPMFRSELDATIVRGIYECLPVLVKHGRPDDARVWPIRYFTMFHMTNDSRLFHTRDELEKQGFYPATGGRLVRGAEISFPLFVGKTIHQFDHRAASVSVSDEALHVATSSNATTPEQHRDPDFAPTPQFWVDAREVKQLWPANLEWAIGFRDIARATDARTVIASVVPMVAFGNKLPLIMPLAATNPEETDASNSAYRATMPFLLANLNSLIFDYVARQKVHGTNLNWYIFEHCPWCRRARSSGGSGASRSRTSFAARSCGSSTPRRTWRHSRAISAMAARPSAGTKRIVVIAAPASTRYFSDSTDSTKRRPGTCWALSRSCGSRTKPNSASGSERAISFSAICAPWRWATPRSVSPRSRLGGWRHGRAPRCAARGGEKISSADFRPRSRSVRACHAAFCGLSRTTSPACQEIITNLISATYCRILAY